MLGLDNIIQLFQLYEMINWKAYSQSTINAYQSELDGCNKHGETIFKKM